MQTDSTRIQITDTLPQITTESQNNKSGQQDTITSINTVIGSTPVLIQNSRQSELKETADTISNTDLLKTQSKTLNKTYYPFTFCNKKHEEDSSVYHPKLTNQVFYTQSAKSNEFRLMDRNTDIAKEKDWVSGVALLALILMLSLVVYFRKQLQTVIAAAFNFQLSEKLGREKNAVIKRVFFILNINFILSMAVYLYILVLKVFGENTEYKHFMLFLLVFSIVTIFLLLRYIVLHLIGNIFDSVQVFREFSHNSLLLSKNLGIYLLPIVLSYFFLPEIIKPIAFYLATVIAVIMLLYRYLRSLQIILRYKVLYFYTILYLCTLEILPVIVGVKFVLSLR